MKLLVLGHSVADIIDFNNKKTFKPGGIFYSIIALNNFKENDDKISLVTAVDSNHYHLFKDEYEKLDEKFFIRVDRVPVVHLKIEPDKERHETYENINQNLLYNINNLNLFDGILINMITGFDITLQQLKEIRKNFNGPIYFDVHTLSRGLNNKMQRYFRTIPQFNQWASCIDMLQVNKNELGTLNEKVTDEEIIKEALSYGIKYIILTLEEKGAKVFYLEEGILKSIYEPAIKVDVKNKVGCGDVFGALFFYSYISVGKEIFEHKNINKPLKIANIAAGYAASYEDMNEFKNLKKDVIRET